MIKTYLLLISLALSALLAACASDKEFIPSESDKLTKAETAALIIHAKTFIAGNKHLKLNAAERECVKANDPEVFVKYSDKKEGHLSFSWQISEAKRLILTLDGELISESKQKWALQIVSTGKPEFYKSPEDAPDAKQSGK